MIDKAGIYDMTLDAYVADPVVEPSLSSSIAHMLLEESPLHAWHKHPKLNPKYRSQEASRFDIGTAAHAILLEGDRSKIAVIDAPDYRTKEAKIAQAEARALGHTPVLAHQMVQVEAMVEVAQEAIGNSEMSEMFTPSQGKSEQTLIWKDSGVWLRSRPDWLTNVCDVILDYKTTTCAEPNHWTRTMLGNGFHLQAALALRGIKHLTGQEQVRFVFMVQETEPPYAMSFPALSPAFLTHADQRLQDAITKWRTCLETCNWPSYPTRIAYLDLPNWAWMQWEAQRDVEEMEA